MLPTNQKAKKYWFLSQLPCYYCTFYKYCALTELPLLSRWITILWRVYRKLCCCCSQLKSLPLLLMMVGNQKVWLYVHITAIWNKPSSVRIDSWLENLEGWHTRLTEIVAMPNMKLLETETLCHCLKVVMPA